MQKILFSLLVLILTVGIVLTLLPWKDFKNTCGQVSKKSKTEAMVGHIVATVAVVLAFLWLGMLVLGNKIRN